MIHCDLKRLKLDEDTLSNSTGKLGRGGMGGGGVKHIIALFALVDHTWF